jgi:hypothetical protein
MRMHRYNRREIVDVQARPNGSKRIIDILRPFPGSSGPDPQRFIEGSNAFYHVAPEKNAVRDRPLPNVIEVDGPRRRIEPSKLIARLIHGTSCDAVIFRMAL